MPYNSSLPSEHPRSLQRPVNLRASGIQAAPGSLYGYGAWNEDAKPIGHSGAADERIYYQKHMLLARNPHRIGYRQGLVLAACQRAAAHFIHDLLIHGSAIGLTNTIEDRPPFSFCISAHSGSLSPCKAALNVLLCCVRRSPRWKKETQETLSPRARRRLRSPEIGDYRHIFVFNRFSSRPASTSAYRAIWRKWPLVLQNCRIEHIEPTGIAR